MAFTNTDRSMLVELHTDMKNIKKNDEDKEKRLRVLEKGRFREMGAIGVFGSALGYLATHFFR